ncbi:MAG: excinuclease ABC subunit UvrA [Thermomicrobiales bacterium]|nr:excinuclease ABC subunit UvrA [Thermomicrobiales bacterium]
MHPADDHAAIRVRGARVNNLKDIDIDLPKRRLTVFTGLSGSGKSSLVFSTIAAESQRLINETYPAFVQGFMPTLARPEVDLMDGLTTAIIVDQQRMGSDPRSTVGTATDANAMLRMLFSRCGDPQIGSPNAYSFNVPSASGSGGITVQRGDRTITEKADFNILGGMCPRCEGRGTVSGYDMTKIYDEEKTITEGAILVPNYSIDGWYGRIFSNGDFFPADKPVKKFTKRELHALLYKEPTRIKVDGINVTYEGVLSRIEKTMLAKDVDAMQPHVRRFVESAVTFETCPECGGTRLSQQALGSKIMGKNIADCCAMQVSDLAEWVKGIKEPSVAPLLEGLQRILNSFVEIGLGYLSLDRPAGTLSGGEAQRVKMIRHLGSALTDVTYVFDEPTAGLHPADIERMNALLQQLRDKGNTVLVVEHKPSVMAIADYLVDMGPGAGAAGGEIVFQGDLKGLLSSDTTTGKHLEERIGLRGDSRQPNGTIPIRDANLHNLKNVDIDIPTGVLVTITGVAGSGKSSLIDAGLARRDDVMIVDQSPIRGSIRSNPATFSGLLDPIRTAFAKANGVKPALFSANSEGACPVCNGTGVITVDLGFMASVSTVCEECGGKRYRAEVLEYRLDGLNISEVLDLTAAEAAGHFTTGNASKIIGLLNDVGLGYIRIGQQLNTLSGGERQRLKLAASLRTDNAPIYVLDEPTNGLHLADTDNMIAMLHKLVDSGKSIIVVEHNLAVMAQSDWIIDIGPGAGHDGGKVVYEGSPAEMIAKSKTATARYLKDWVQG